MNETTDVLAKKGLTYYSFFILLVQHWFLNENSLPIKKVI